MNTSLTKFFLLHSKRRLNSERGIIGIMGALSLFLIGIHLLSQSFSLLHQTLRELHFHQRFTARIIKKRENTLDFKDKEAINTSITRLCEKNVPPEKNRFSTCWSNHSQTSLLTFNEALVFDSCQTQTTFLDIAHYRCSETLIEQKKFLNGFIETSEIRLSKTRPHLIVTDTVSVQHLVVENSVEGILIAANSLEIKNITLCPTCSLTLISLAEFITIPPLSNNQALYFFDQDSQNFKILENLKGYLTVHTSLFHGYFS